MPELPEVETIRSGLERVLPGRKIKRADVFFAASVAVPDSGEFSRLLPGRVFTGTGRRGKYLHLCLDDNSVITVHLRMTGRLIYSEEERVVDKHTHVVISLEGKGRIYFHDVRKFGRIWWLPADRTNEVGGLAGLGPEPLSEGFNIEHIEKYLHKRATSIKSVLLNQSFVAGLGNIYADEILHKCGIMPQRRADTLSRGEKEALLKAVREVLSEAISWRGTTFSDYRDALGETGGFQNRLKVYHRHTEPCPVCGTCISRAVVAGRGTHYCPRCQH